MGFAQPYQELKETWPGVHFPFFPFFLPFMGTLKSQSSGGEDKPCRHAPAAVSSQRVHVQAWERSSRGVYAADAARCLTLAAGTSCCPGGLLAQGPFLSTELSGQLSLPLLDSAARGNSVYGLGGRRSCWRSTTTVLAVWYAKLCMARGDKRGSVLFLFQLLLFPFIAVFKSYH